MIALVASVLLNGRQFKEGDAMGDSVMYNVNAVSYTHLRAHETVLDLVCRLLLAKKKTTKKKKEKSITIHPITVAL